MVWPLYYHLRYSATHIFSVCPFFFSSRLFHWRLNLFVMLIVLIFIIPFYSSYKIVSSIRLGESIFPLFFFLHSSCIFSLFPCISPSPSFSLYCSLYFPPQCSIIVWHVHCLSSPGWSSCTYSGNWAILSPSSLPNKVYTHTQYDIVWLLLQSLLHVDFSPNRSAVDRATHQSCGSDRSDADGRSLRIWSCQCPLHLHDLLPSVHTLAPILTRQ